MVSAAECGKIFPSRENAGMIREYTMQATVTTSCWVCSLGKGPSSLVSSALQCMSCWGQDRLLAFTALTHILLESYIPAFCLLGKDLGQKEDFPTGDTTGYQLVDPQNTSPQTNSDNDSSMRSRGCGTAVQDQEAPCSSSVSAGEEGRECN